ncbi:helix-turn-helix domain-containing protein [Desulfovibrio sp. OttesenSCG-928-C14]|nr:helix-turn-helix domain-containing protein [Desulfovibrio sp. OttesenSCG-928-C14]
MPESRFAETLGGNIAERRRKLGLSQRELATKLGITYDSMARMERGKVTPKISRLPEIAEALQCSVSYLFHTNDDTTGEMTATIVDILKTLPQEGQEAMVELVATAARVMRIKS